jgi:hypothetical protein
VPSPHVNARLGLPWGAERTPPQSISVGTSATELVAGTGPLDTRDRLIINPAADIYVGSDNTVTTSGATKGLLVKADAWLELDGRGTWYGIGAAASETAIYEVKDLP